MRYFSVTLGFWSTSSLTTFRLPFISLATCSSAGAMALHGPHHSAKKSTSTGSDDCKTSCSKLASETSRAVPAMRVFSLAYRRVVRSIPGLFDRRVWQGPCRGENVDRNVGRRLAGVKARHLSATAALHGPTTPRAEFP